MADAYTEARKQAALDLAEQLPELWAAGNKRHVWDVLMLQPHDKALVALATMLDGFDADDRGDFAAFACEVL